MTSFGAIDLKGVDNMLDSLESAAVAQDDSETLSENVFRRIQAAIVKGEIAPAARFPSRNWPALMASAAGRCVKPCTVLKVSACWCGCRM